MPPSTNEPHEFEQALLRSEERHRLIVEGARDYAILTTDPDGRIESWSPGAEAVFGWSADEAVGQNAAMTFTPEDREAAAPEMERALARERGSAPDVRWHLRKDGTRVFIEGVTRALEDGAGGVRGFLKIGQDVTERRRTDDAMRELNESLERRVAERTAELVTAEEVERRRISRELHDQMGQLVTGMLLGLRALRTEAPAHLAGRVAGLEELAQRIARELQHLALQLRPPALDSLGVGPALRAHLEEWAERHGVECDFHAVGLDGPRLAPEVEITLYRVVQEGLTNVLKHANARSVSLVLERRAGGVSAILEDNGAGFDADAVMAAAGGAGRLGLRGMRERLALVGGSLEVESRPGDGTTLFARIPLAAGERDG